MNGVEVVCSATCNNLGELMAVLVRMSKDALHYVANCNVSVNDGAVVVSVERQVLSDGSEVYNINIEP